MFQATRIIIIFLLLLRFLVDGAFLLTSTRHRPGFVSIKFRQPDEQTEAGTTNERGIPFLYMSSFTSDGSEYSSSDSDYNTDDDDMMDNRGRYGYRSGDDEEDGDGSGVAPTIELQPVPMSKNSGNRFVAVVWDRLLHPNRTHCDVLDMHYDRIALTEDHVMFCRKANLYNETFNTESMVDILWSRQILSTDLQRTIGHAMCLESTKLEYVQDVLSRDPIVQKWTGGDISQIPLYRWRHIRDYTLRQDDGRFGTPAMLLAFDELYDQPTTGTDDDDNEEDEDDYDNGGDDELVGLSDSHNIRQETSKAVLEYLIRSERVIAAGPLHLPTEFKNDPSSLPVGDLIMFNAKDRDEAIAFCEALPSAQQGLYQSMKVYFYNNFDVTGKFVSEDPFRESPCDQMKDALEYWGYPVDDEQTPWLNW